VTSYKRGDDVLVDFAGTDDWWPGEILSVEKSGYVLCRVHVDPLHDFGRAGARVMPEQTVAVRSNRIRPREEGNANG
jgi:hypothetical protein